MQKVASSLWKLNARDSISAIKQCSQKKIMPKQESILILSSFWESVNNYNLNINKIHKSTDMTIQDKESIKSFFYLL